MKWDIRDYEGIATNAFFVEDCSCENAPLFSWRDYERLLFVFQHGFNPEAQLLVPDELVRSQTHHPAASWLKRVHDYLESGIRWDLDE